MNAASVVNEGGKYFFVQGKVRFEVDADPKVGIQNSIFKIDSLPANEQVELANLNGLPVEPFNKKLLRPVLMGIVQNAWYQGVMGKIPDKVNIIHKKRVDDYSAQLEAFKNRPQANPDVVARVSRRRSSGEAKPQSAPRQAKAYRLTEAKRDVWSKFDKGQKAAIVKIMKSLGAEGTGPGATVDSIAAASQGAMDTSTDPKRIVHFYINQFQHSGIVEVVGEQAQITDTKAEPAVEPQPTRSAEEKPKAKKAGKGK